MATVARRHQTLKAYKVAFAILDIYVMQGSLVQRPPVLDDTGIKNGRLPGGKNFPGGTAIFQKRRSEAFRPLLAEGLALQGYG
jgi:hypothetical protein